jgi:hypothetical protein
MSVYTKLIFRPIFNLIWDAVRRIGALIRWTFLGRKYEIDEIYRQNWSVVVGLVFLSFFISIGVLLIG